jgi:hypothetical protein
LLDFTVVRQVTLKGLDSLLHHVVLVHQIFRLHRVVLEFSSELNILDDGKFGSAHELVLVHVQHLHLHSSNLQQHLLSQVVNLLDLLPFYLIHHLILLLPLLL